MAEPTAAEVASERDVLLATKLHVPRPGPGMVPRPRLTRHLDECLEQGLVLVCAPAGYGKTVLLADWARRRQRPVAWLSLDEGDNDPIRFWRYAVAALDRVRPGISERVGPLLGPPTPPSFAGVVIALINDLAPQQKDEAVLVLDDYHAIGSQPVHASLKFLLEHRPPGLRLVLASRADPPLALARLRARGQLAELRAAELRFTAEEAAALLRQLVAGADASLPDADVAALTARTEGWAAGLQLAGLSLRGQADAAGFVADFTGSHRYVLDFLTQEVLECQPEQVRAFLLETSVLERLSGPLSDAVTGRGGSQELLEQVERAGLFLVPLDEVRGWWRFHHLFADLLRARLREEQPAQVAQLHRNAAAWHEEHGLSEEAIRHAVAAGEMTWAARLIERQFDTVSGLRGEGVTVQRWLAALPADLVRSRPRLLLAQAQLAAATGRVETVERLVEAAERAHAGAAEEPFEPPAGRAGSLLVNIPALIAVHRSLLAWLRGDAEATAAFASRALAELGEGERLGHLGVHVRPERLPGFHVHRGGRLVQHDQVGLAHDGQGEPDALGLAAGQLVHPAAGQVGDARPPQGLAHRQRPGMEPGHQRHQLPHGHLGHQPAGLEHRADPPGLDRVVRVGTEHADPAAGRSAQREQHVQRRRLARPVGPEQGHGLPGPELQRQPVNRPDLAVHLANVFERDNRRPVRRHESRTHRILRPHHDSPADQEGTS
jgi:LuxR family transcriptional regulator, maltose regulon positive regulatory protein